MGRGLGALVTCSLGCYAGVGGAGPGDDEVDDTGEDADAGDGDDGGGDGEDDGAEGDGADVPPPGRDLQRLTRYEYRNTLQSLFPPVVLERVASALELIPHDEVPGTFDAERQEITEAHVLTYASVARFVAEAAFAEPEARAEIAPCYDDSPDQACATSFVESFGPRVLRRPLTDDDVAAYLELFDAALEEGTEHAFVAVLSAMLQSPDFIFRLELEGEDTDQADTFELEDHAVANRLAYYLWGTPPDDMLWASAEQGSLSETSTLVEQVDRMLADDRARAHLRHYYRQWLAIDRPTPSRNVESLPEWIADPDSLEGLNDAMDAEIYGLVDHLLWEQEAGFAALMTTDQTYVTAPNLGALYEVDGELEQVLAMDPSVRSGLLTRLHFTATANGASDPIHRGVLVARQLLCRQLGAPDPEVLEDVDMSEIDPLASTREQIETLTQAPACAGCHDVFNDLGFALEDFDGLGRPRALEAVVDGDGTVLAEHPVDAAVEVALDPGMPVAVDGGVELGRALAESNAANRCATEQWFSFQGGRRPSAEHDDVLLDMQTTLNDPQGGIVAMVRAFALRPDFSRRRVTQ